MNSFLQNACAVFLITLLPGLATCQTIEAAQLPVAPDSNATKPTAHKTVRLSRHREVEVRLEQDLSSATTKVGDGVRFRLVQDLAVDGHLLARAGSPLFATVTEVRPRDAHHNGKLTLGDLELDLGHGQSISFKGGTVESDIDDDTWAFVLGGIIIFPIGIAALVRMARESAKEAKNPTPKVPKTFEMELRSGETFHPRPVRTFWINLERSSATTSDTAPASCF